MKTLSMIALLVATAGAGTPLMLNEDNSHFYFFWPSELMTEAGLHAWVDQYADTSVTHLFLNANAMRASFDSATRDAIWETGAQATPAPGSAGEKWIANARALFERGLDPYAVWIARAREKKLAPWITMRMNDIHDVDDSTNYMHSTFWVNHPEFRRVPENPQSWQDRALDFTHPEVREHAMSFVRELLDRYDADGLELDWMRFPYHLAPGQEEAGRAILTDFMREVRAHAKTSSEKRGHPIAIGARVPTHPDNASGLGMDAVLWAKEGLIDVLVPTPFWASCDSDVPMELWRERLGDANDLVMLAGGIEFLVGAYPGAKQVAAGTEVARGYAASMLHRGAEAIYLFNYMDSGPDAASNVEYHALLREGLSMEAATSLPRRHIMTYRDTVAPGATSNAQLPVALDAPRTLSLHLGPKPEHGTAMVRIGLSVAEGDVSDDALPAVAVNGTDCKRLDAAIDLAQVPGAQRAMDATIDRAALRDGFNDIVLTPQGGSANVVWVEIRIVP